MYEGLPEKDWYFIDLYEVNRLQADILGLSESILGLERMRQHLRGKMPKEYHDKESFSNINPNDASFLVYSFIATPGD
jgi:hypothetical protein